MLETEDELAAILAHEIAHINRHHRVMAIKSARWTEAVTMISAKAVSEYSSSELGQLVNIFSGSIDDIFKTLVVKGYGRPQELEADSDAITILRKTGYDPQGVARFLEKLHAAKADSSKGGGILSTHPGIEERIEAAKSLATGSLLIASQKEKRTKRFHSYF